jgi:hypothetical protein
VGGITGALIGMGIPEYEAKRYEGKLKSGNVLISVHIENNDEQKRAREILNQIGAEDISVSGEAKVPGGEKHGGAERRTGTGTGTGTGTERTAEC